MGSGAIRRRSRPAGPPGRPSSPAGPRPNGRSGWPPDPRVSGRRAAGTGTGRGRPVRRSTAMRRAWKVRCSERRTSSVRFRVQQRLRASRTRAARSRVVATGLPVHLPGDGDRVGLVEVLAEQVRQGVHRERLQQVRGGPAPGVEAQVQGAFGLLGEAPGRIVDLHGGDAEIRPGSSRSRRTPPSGAAAPRSSCGAR